MEDRRKHAGLPQFKARQVRQELPQQTPDKPAISKSVMKHCSSHAVKNGLLKRHRSRDDAEPICRGARSRRHPSESERDSNRAGLMSAPAAGFLPQRPAYARKALLRSHLW
jgi:hypothetical protein